MCVFICSMYLNQLVKKPQKLEPAFVKPCVSIVHVVNTYGCRLGLVYTVAVPCTSFLLLLFVAVARTLIWFVLLDAPSC